MAGIDRSCVLVLDVDEARCAASAAASLDMPVAILSVRDGALTAGIGWFDAIMRAARHQSYGPKRSELATDDVVLNLTRELQSRVKEAER